MKTVGLWFAIGITAGGVISFAYRESLAKSEDPRVSQNTDSALSGMRVPVPNAQEAEGEIVKRQKELDERSRLLQEQEQRLVVEEQRLKIRVDELQKLQDDILQAQDQNRQRSDEIIKKIVKTFESMSPKKAASVMTTMHDPLAVEIVLNMKEKRVAAILEAMDPTRAMTLSSLVAQRRPAGKAIGEKAGSAK